MQYATRQRVAEMKKQTHVTTSRSGGQIDAKAKSNPPMVKIFEPSIRAGKQKKNDNHEMRISWNS